MMTSSFMAAAKGRSSPQQPSPDTLPLFPRVQALASTHTRPFVLKNTPDVCERTPGIPVITAVQFSFVLGVDPNADGAFAALTIADESHKLMALLIGTFVIVRANSPTGSAACFYLPFNAYVQFVTGAASVYVMDNRELPYHFNYNIENAQHGQGNWLLAEVIGPLKPDPRLCKAFEIKLIPHPFSLHEHEEYVHSRWPTQTHYRLGYLHELHALQTRLIVANEPMSSLLQNSFYMMLSYFRIGHHRKAEHMVKWMDQNVKEMSKSLKAEYLVVTSRMAYNLGKFPDSVKRLQMARLLLRDHGDAVLADCWFESALVYAHMGKTKSARACFTNAIRLLDFNCPNPKLFAKCMLYAVLCIAFLGDPSYHYITRVGCKVPYDALDELEKIVRIQPPVIGFGFSAWACEALVRARLKLIEHLSLPTLVPPMSYITSELLECLKWLQEGFRLCHDYDILVNLPGMFKAAGMLASITHSPISTKAGAVIADHIGFVFHAKDHEAWKVSLPYLETNSEMKALLESFLVLSGWRAQWDSLLEDYGLPKDDRVIDDVLALPGPLDSDYQLDSEDAAADPK